MKSARRVAFDTLLKVYKDGAYSNIALDRALEENQLTPVDRSFASLLVYGVVERTLTIDYQLERYLTQPIGKLKPQALVILRLGIFQLFFADKVPASAAVNESVKLSKQCGCAYASGLINAVLRKADKNGLCLPDESDRSKYLSIKYSCPEWIINMWISQYGEENAAGLCEATLGAVPAVLRVNTLRTDTASLIADLKNDGAEAEASDIVENAVVVKDPGSLRALESYSKGLFHVQDTASQLCCRALDAQEGETVLDICSAPGGKAFTAAQYMKNSGKIIACDIYPHRLKLIESGAERLGINIIETLQNDAAKFNDDFPKFDKILCDVPCAGLGVIRRKPEIRLKKAAEVDKLPEIQYSILKTASLYLKENGVLIYSTCSLNKNENENVYKRFLKEHRDFEPVKVLPEIQRYGEQTDYLTLFPHIHGCDGFFISALRRRKAD